MIVRLTRRLLQFPLVLAIVYTITFLLMSAAPGNPLIGEFSKVPPEVLENQKKLYGLDKPLHVQYWRYVSAAAASAARGRLELGRSIYYGGKPVAEVLGLTSDTWAGGALQTSLTLGVLALALSVLAGINLGISAARRQNRLADHVTSGLAVVGVSFPMFVTGTAIIAMLAIALPIFPVGGWGGIRQMVLPAIVLSMPFTAYIARLTRAGMLDALHADYIRTARAKGLDERQVAYKHAFKLAFLPVLSYLGPAAAAILTGSFVVEKLFAIPGIGTHFVQSVISRDQPVILATVLLYAAMLVTFNLVVDMAYLFVDPRIAREAAV